MRYNLPTAALSGIFLLILGIVFGYFVYRPGYGSGPEGVIDMFLGIGIAFAGCLASFVLGIVSLAIKEQSIAIGVVAVTTPILMIILGTTGVLSY